MDGTWEVLPMNLAERPQPALSDVEWQLVIELLEREQKELPSEIRHTRTISVKDELHRRSELVKKLLHRIRHELSMN
jgi:hypothetical protein